MLHCEPELLLRCGAYEATVAPRAGARVTRLSWTDENLVRHELLVPLRERCFEATDWPKAGAFAMLPFTNRLPATGLFAESDWLAKAPGCPPGQQHGLGLRRPWQLVERTASHVVLSLLHPSRSPDWPWSFQASMELRLSAEGLALELALTNTSADPMPGSIGWHPYHPHWPADPHGPVFTAAFHVPMNEAGASGPAGTWSAMTPQQAPQAKAVTTAFSGWGQSAMLRVDAEVNAHVQTRGWPHLVLHQPANGGYVCFEPVSLLPGHLGQVATTGKLSEPGWIAPGRTLSASWQCSAKPC